MFDARGQVDAWGGLWERGVPGDSVRVSTAIEPGFERAIVLVVLVFGLLTKESWRVLAAELRHEEEDAFYHLVRENKPEKAVAEPRMAVVVCREW